MLNLPRPPKSYLTLQIECVACRESFTIAEDSGEHTRSTHSIHWRTPAAQQPHIHMQYDPNLDHKPTSPPHLPNVHNLSHDQRGHNGDTPINCPRCGADNRNWVHLLHDKKPIWRKWPRQFPLAVISICITVLFTMTSILAIRLIGKGATDLQIILLPFFTLLSGTLVAYAVTQQWKTLRNDNLEKRFLPEPKRVAPTVTFRIGLTLSAIFTLIVPLLLFIFLPSALNFFRNLAAPPPPSPNNITKTIIEKLDELAAVEGLSDVEQGDIKDLKDGFSALITSMSEFENPQDANGTDNYQPQSDFPTRFLLFWGILVGLSTGMATLLSAAAVQTYENRVTSQLPSPIYHSVAEMTRVVIWEARHALEAKNNLDQVQWMGVERNELGGIDLTGLYREMPEFDERGNPLGATVRAQHYLICTDKWGRIEDAEIKDVRVPHPAGTPRYVITPAQLQQRGFMTPGGLPPTAVPANNHRGFN